MQDLEHLEELMNIENSQLEYRQNIAKDKNIYGENEWGLFYADGRHIAYVTKDLGELIVALHNALPSLLQELRAPRELAKKVREMKCCGGLGPFGNCGRGKILGCNGLHCKCMRQECSAMHYVDCRQHYIHVEHLTTQDSVREE